MPSDRDTVERSAAGARPEPPLALDRFLPYRLSVLSNRISRAIETLYTERFALTIPEWRVMAVLAAYAPLSANEVADRTAMDKVQVSRAVARLSQAGRIERRTDPDDRRRSALRLSPTGRRVYRQIVPLARAVETDLLAALDPDERQMLDRLLRKLRERAERL